MSSSRFPIARHRRGGFTLLEIAVSLAVIGFAIVAVLGVLPSGLNIQRDTRERTIVTQDAAYIIEAIRRGSMDTLSAQTNLVNRVDDMHIITIFQNLQTTDSYRVNRDWFPNDGEFIKRLAEPIRSYGPLSQISVRVLMRSLTGSAAEQGGNADYDRIMFKYYLTAEVVPVTSVDESVVYDSAALDPLERSYRDGQMRSMTNNLSELRLKISWPAGLATKPTGEPAWKRDSTTKSMEFRTLLSGALVPDTGRWPALGNRAWDHPRLAIESLMITNVYK
ncbi:MAG: type II secretion system protein [Verrucomicrobia bacterium]|nr:type II secretion system protein [Verrucomicrobiota bacterium]